MNRPSSAATARIRRFVFLPLAYLVPIAAAAVAGLLVFRSMPEHGPVITLTAQDAEDLRVGSTTVRYRGTSIGEVARIGLSESMEAARIEVALEPGMERFAQAGARFWVVKPELTLEGVRGLRTIVSGRYIAALPGAGDRRSEFRVEPLAPLPNLGPGDLRVVLNASERQGVERGTAVEYRGIEIGVVERVGLSDDASYVKASTVIFDEYAPLVRTGSVFWRTNGLDIEASLFEGLKLKAGDLRSLLAGRIAMASPPDTGDAAEENRYFALHDKPLPEWTQWTTKIPWNEPPK